jgi:hypothetical protein
LGIVLFLSRLGVITRKEQVFSYSVPVLIYFLMWEKYYWVKINKGEKKNGRNKDLSKM